MQSVLPDIEIVNISEVKLNKKNPRIIKDEKYLKLIESIRNFPEMLYIRPIVIDIHNRIIGGNQRYSACKDLGYQEIPIIRAINLSKRQYDEFILKDNTSSGQWDIDKLINEWDNELVKICDIDINKYSDIEIEKKTTEQNDQKDDNNKKDDAVSMPETTVCPKCGFEWSKV